MAKQIYVPTMDELYTIQDMNINVYNYLLSKVIELLTLEGVICYKKGILKNEYKYFKENPELVRAICTMYPEELEYSEIGKYDVELCLDLINNKHDNTIYNLDNLSLFSNLTRENLIVIRNVISILDCKLQNNPKYRFEYKQNNLLDSIFNTEFINNIFYEKRMLESLSRIEPAYILKDKTINSEEIKKEMLTSAIESYVSRYKLSQSKGMISKYDGKDILTLPDENTKRLIRCIEKNRKYLM